ncbi:MAG: rod shape-determining protein MreC [Terracidiphilus sp.]|nr:rod shape-determining protein MreC [Terracidiphilus sp.]MDR3777290.1 rod shape-determining protein MreC [Terracidiphilus sp.]
MEPFFIRYRNLLVLLVILVAQIIGLAVQVRRTSAGRVSLDPQDGPGVRLIRLWADAVVTPPERMMHSTKLGTIDLWQNYLDLRHVSEKNQDLQKTIDRLRLEQAELLEDARQGQRLQALLDFQQKYVYKTLAAQAIGSSGSDQSRVFYIDKGADYHLDRDMAVITPDGIVGKVREVFPHTAQVLVINDQTSGAGVILETTRIRGILRGNALGQPQIVGILADQRIQPGEKVFTAGGDLIFPRGLPVGVVQKVVRDPERDSFINVIVQPAAHLDRLDEVLVITSAQSRFSPEQQQDLATSEALKGADATAIKEQKKASEVMAERLPGLTDPNAPVAQPAAGAATTPGQAQATPAVPVVPTAPKLLHAQHADRFSPATAQESAPATKTEPKPKLDANPQQPVKTPQRPRSQQNPKAPLSKVRTAPSGTATQSPATKSGQPVTPRRNP